MTCELIVMDHGSISLSDNLPGPMGRGPKSSDEHISRPWLTARYIFCSVMEWTVQPMSSPYTLREIYRR